MFQHAQSRPDEEVCGLIGAVDGIPESYYAIDNCHDARAIRFSMDTLQQIEATRKIRKNGETLLGVFHSHPKGAAIPSSVDRAEADDPELIHLICSLNQQGVLEMRGYKTTQGQVADEVNLQIV